MECRRCFGCPLHMTVNKLKRSGTATEPQQPRSRCGCWKPAEQPAAPPCRCCRLDHASVAHIDHEASCEKMPVKQSRRFRCFLRASVRFASAAQETPQRGGSRVASVRRRTSGAVLPGEIRLAAVTSVGDRKEAAIRRTFRRSRRPPSGFWADSPAARRRVSRAD